MTSSWKYMEIQPFIYTLLINCCTTEVKCICFRSNSCKQQEIPDSMLTQFVNHIDRKLKIVSKYLEKCLAVTSWANLKFAWTMLQGMNQTCHQAPQILLTQKCAAIADIKAYMIDKIYGRPHNLKWRFQYNNYWD